METNEQIQTFYIPPLDMILKEVANLNEGEPMGMLQIIEKNEGLIPDGWEKLYELLSQKVDNIGLSVAMNEAEIDALKSFKQKIQDRIQSKSNALDNFKRWLSKAVEQFGDLERTKTNPIGSKWFRGKVVSIKRTETIEVTIEKENEKYIPAEYKDFEITLTPKQYHEIRLKLGKNKELLSALDNPKESIDKTKIKETLQLNPKLEIPGVQVTEKKSVTFYNIKKLIQAPDKKEIGNE